MPAIEIASINSTGLRLNQADFDVAIIEENKLESHRGLFFELLRQQSGTIVHIGNPDFKYDKEGGYFAGQNGTQLRSRAIRAEEYILIDMNTMSFTSRDMNTDRLLNLTSTIYLYSADCPVRHPLVPNGTFVAGNTEFPFCARTRVR